MPLSAAMLRILADCRINPAFVEDGGRIDLAWTIMGRIFDLASVPEPIFWRNEIGPPNGLQLRPIWRLLRFRIKSITPAITTAEKNQPFTVYLASGRRGPLSVQDPRADIRVIFALQPTCQFVKCHE